MRACRRDGRKLPQPAAAWALCGVLALLSAVAHTHGWPGPGSTGPSVAAPAGSSITTSSCPSCALARSPACPAADRVGVLGPPLQSEFARPADGLPLELRTIGPSASRAPPRLH
jgi:hypothetical protein